MGIGIVRVGKKGKTKLFSSKTEEKEPGWDCHLLLATFPDPVFALPAYD
jgi:hypothetical protein